MSEIECYRCRRQEPEVAFTWYYPILGEGLCRDCCYSMDDIEHEADIEYCKMLYSEAYFVAEGKDLKE